MPIVTMLATRAKLYAGIRSYFAAQNVLEVSTPILSAAASCDVNLHSLHTNSSFGQRFMHTSPEFAMKRLLCAGVGDCYQIAKVFRDMEMGRLHNVEFELVEWYRLGFSLADIMADTLALVRYCQQHLKPANAAAAPDQLNSQLNSQRYRYSDIFEQKLGLNPLFASQQQLQQLLAKHDLWHKEQGELKKSAALDLLFDQCVAASFDANCLTLIYDYPKQQAALAALNDDGLTAARFELYFGKVELANGYFELCDAKQQRQRFAADNKQRQQQGLDTMPCDENLLQAMEKQGLPKCSGVALGIDRLLMLLTAADSVSAVMAFDFYHS